MGNYIRKRILGLIIVLWGVTLLTFIFSIISPVDPAEALARRSILSPTPAQINQFRLEMGLDLPLAQQYLHWLGQSLQGNLGTSLLTRNPVSVDIAAKLPATVSIVALAFVWVILLTVPVSILVALRKDGFLDHTVRMITLIGISVPNFWLGFMLLAAFAVALPLFKVVDYGSLKSMILPSFTLAIPVAASAIRLFRAALLANLNQDFVVYARARGIPPHKIIGKHVLKNSLPPMITFFAQNLGYMLAGSAIVETVFSWPGIGSHLVEAIMGRDLPTVNGCVLVIALIFVFCNLLADIVNMLLNPKMINEKGEI